MVALVRPSFSTANEAGSEEPLKALQVVDIYKEKAGEVVNSYTEQTQQEESFLDKLKNGFSLGSVKDYIKDASSLLKTAAQGASAFAALKAGGIYGVTSGLSQVARMTGVGGVVSTISKASQIASIATGGSSLMQKGLSLANASGFNTSPLTRLVGSSTSALNSFSAFNNLPGGNVLSTLSAAGRLTDTASGFMSSLDSATGFDYQKAMGKVGDFYTGQYGNLTKAGSSIGSRISGGVDTVISSLTGRSYDEIDDRPIYMKDTRGAASLVAGITLTSVNAGVPGTFSRIASEVKNVDLIKAASAPLLDIASKSGNLALAQEIYGANQSAGTLGSLISLKTPNAAANLIKNVSFDAFTKDTDLSKSRDSLIGLVDAVDPNWNKASFRSKTILSAECSRDNPYVGELFSAGVSNSKQATALFTETGATKPQVSEDAFHVAAGHFSSSDTKNFYSDQVLTDLW